MSISIEWAKTSELIPHEDILLDLLNQTIENIRRNKKVVPIIVDEETKVILDGHHRFYSLLFLGISKVPVFYVRYISDDVKVNFWYRQIKPSVSLRFQDQGEYCVTDEYENKVLCEFSLYKLYWKQHMLEQNLIKSGFSVLKNPYAGLKIPPLPKEYIVSIAMKGLRFPPKSTRHEYKFYIPKEEIDLNEY